MSSRNKQLTGLAKDIQEKFFFEIGVANLKYGKLRDVEIAIRSGMSPSYYSLLVNYQRPLSIEMAVNIAAVFDLDVTLLLYTP